MYSPARLVAGTTATVTSGFSMALWLVLARLLPHAARPATAITAATQRAEIRANVTGPWRDAAGIRAILESPLVMGGLGGRAELLASEARPSGLNGGKNASVPCVAREHGHR